MRAIFDEMGSFMVELLAGSAVIVTGIGIWIAIQQFMDKVVYLLV